MQNKHRRARVRILVKAFPQHSDKHEETVCCAGITEDQQLIRLYPITYRRLARENQFNRYDLVEATLTKAANDIRPESYRVDHDSIEVIERGSSLDDENKVRLWQPHIVTSLTALQDEHRDNGRSLGIVRPDSAGLKFFWKNAELEEQEDSRGVQASLLEEPLRPLAPPELTFFYRYRSGDKEHTQSIQDWEVQATYINYQRQYGSRDKALEMMTLEYGENIPRQNLHFIMGNMAKRQWQFIVIGLLRSGLDPGELARQGSLF
jgi:hypothetical protein